MIVKFVIFDYPFIIVDMRNEFFCPRIYIPEKRFTRYHEICQLYKAKYYFSHYCASINFGILRQICDYHEGAKNILNYRAGGNRVFLENSRTIIHCSVLFRIFNNHLIHLISQHDAKGCDYCDNFEDVMNTLRKKYRQIARI